MSDDALIERFYESLAAGDAVAAAACYTPGARFSDPVFRGLRGLEVGAMWRMLTERSSDLGVELLAHEAGGDVGSAHWRARDTFSQTGRPVLNEIHASFRFADGLIAEHRDDFDLHVWARQALGVPACCSGGARPCVPSCESVPASPSTSSSPRTRARSPGRELDGAAAPQRGSPS